MSQHEEIRKGLAEYTLINDITFWKVSGHNPELPLPHCCKLSYPNLLLATKTFLGNFVTVAFTEVDIFSFKIHKVFFLKNVLDKRGWSKICKFLDQPLLSSTFLKKQTLVVLLYVIFYLMCILYIIEDFFIISWVWHQTSVVSFGINESFVFHKSKYKVEELITNYPCNWSFYSVSDSSRLLPIFTLGETAKKFLMRL